MIGMIYLASQKMVLGPGWIVAGASGLFGLRRFRFALTLNLSKGMALAALL